MKSTVINNWLAFLGFDILLDHLVGDVTRADRQVTAGPTGTKQEAGKPAVPVKLKIQYSFGYDEKPFVYYQESRDCLIKCEMKGKIAIEIFSPDRYKHNLEFLMATDPMQCKQKLNKIYHPAFCALTSNPVMVADKNRVTLQTPISETANLSAFIVSLNSKKEWSTFRQSSNRTSYRVC